MDQIVASLILLAYILTFLLPVNLFAFYRARSEREKNKKILLTYWKLYGGNKAWTEKRK